MYPLLQPDEHVPSMHVASALARLVVQESPQAAQFAGVPRVTHTPLQSTVPVAHPPSAPASTPSSPAASPPSPSMLDSAISPSAVPPPDEDDEAVASPIAIRAPMSPVEASGTAASIDAPDAQAADSAAAHVVAKNPRTERHHR